MSLSCKYPNFISKKTPCGNRQEESEGLSFWYGPLQCHFWLVFQNFSFGSAALDYFFLYFNLIIYPPATILCFPNWEKARKEWKAWLGGKLIKLYVRAPSRFFSKFEFIPLFQSWLKRSNKGFNLHSVHLKIIESFVDKKSLVFVREGVCQ